MGKLSAADENVNARSRSACSGQAATVRTRLLCCAANAHKAASSELQAACSGWCQRRRARRESSGVGWQAESSVPCSSDVLMCSLLGSVWKGRGFHLAFRVVAAELAGKYRSRRNSTSIIGTVMSASKPQQWCADGISCICLHTMRYRQRHVSSTTFMVRCGHCSSAGAPALLRPKTVDGIHRAILRWEIAPRGHICSRNRQAPPELPLGFFSSKYTYCRKLRVVLRYSAPYPQLPRSSALCARTRYRRRQPSRRP